MRRSRNDSTLAVFQKLSDPEITELVDFLMGVLARHAETVIKNDVDLPVSLLPKTESE
jgi:hypothetical protein